MEKPHSEPEESAVTASSPTEQLVEDAAGAYFIALGASTKTGSELDEALESYDVRPVPWSQRESVREELAA